MSGHEAPKIWREPVRGSYPDRRLIALPGRERLKGWRTGLWPPPPLSHLTGARPTGFGSGTADAEMPASGWLAASNGVITGGTLALVADIAFGCSIETELPAATAYTTAELSLSFLRPARPGGTRDGERAGDPRRSLGGALGGLRDREGKRAPARPRHLAPDHLPAARSGTRSTHRPGAVRAARARDARSLPPAGPERRDRAGGLGRAPRRRDRAPSARRRAAAAPAPSLDRAGAGRDRRGDGHRGRCPAPSGSPAHPAGSRAARSRCSPTSRC